MDAVVVAATLSLGMINVVMFALAAFYVGMPRLRAEWHSDKHGAGRAVATEKSAAVVPPAVRDDGCVARANANAHNGGEEGVRMLCF